jgi:DNA-binding response OmpR family regulator
MGRALLIEDSGSLRITYSEYLAHRGLDVYTAHGATDGLALLNAIKPEVTALDIDLREADGFDLIGTICDTGSLCLVVSDRDGPEDRIRALALGADDYVVKPFELEELFLRLRNMLAHRHGAASDSQSTVLDLNGIRVDLVTRSLLTEDGAAGPELTATELAMLRILADNFEKVVGKAELFSAMRGDSYSSATRSLDVSISRLRLKLRTAQARVDIRSVRQAGYILSPSSASRKPRDGE